jgi:hypothetical protein
LGKDVSHGMLSSPALFGRIKSKIKCGAYGRYEEGLCGEMLA